MNSLEHFLASEGWNEVCAMNLLQQKGVVSDNAVTAADVFLEEQKKAIEFLKGGAK